MLRSLSGARLRIILFPREACSFPSIEDVVHEIFPKSGIYLGSLRFVRAGLDCDVLDLVSGILWGLHRVDVVAYVEAFHGEVIHVHPDWTSPIVLVCFVKLIALAQTP